MRVNPENIKTHLRRLERRAYAYSENEKLMGMDVEDFESIMSATIRLIEQFEADADPDHVRQERDRLEKELTYLRMHVRQVVTEAQRWADTVIKAAQSRAEREGGNP